MIKRSMMLSVLVVIAGSLTTSRIPTVLENVLAAGEIHMISRNGPTTYYEGPNGYTGFEYYLAKRFAKHLGVKLVIHDEEDLGLILDAVENRDVHFAAAGLTITDKRQQKIKFSEPYLDVTQKLIYRFGDKKPKTIEDMLGKDIVVIANSSHSEHLRGLQREYPTLTWRELYEAEMLDLLEMVHNGEADFTIVDSNAYQMSESVYPKARVAFEINQPEQVAWAFTQEHDDSLYNQATQFFETIKTAGVINDAMERYYGHLGELDYSGAILFAHRLDSRLPKWQDKLKVAADTYDLDWQLLAALSYQESHWNPKAKSPTGVRGFMMLTRDTAKDVGVKNRLNPDQSINGGAKYFKSIYNRIPQRITEPDRTWLTLAAYNIGLGHLEDARILTEHHGGNPDKWADVRENLSLLAKRKYYKFTKHGYARGWEAVEYVQNIRNFYTIIAWDEKEKLQQQLSIEEKTKRTFAQFSPVMTEVMQNIDAPTSSL
ncbi:membrane-bound lytic murein transglycosylase MltF [Agarilytica rhodophyticola]|uniref:membrane-bound lytic murein transglycosylase MltF n=1 Tax=Agarilytica rhodophyticola TaxID=1737490 RepID=UPI000B344180|nr:membrane-bound lytic murein transglycosylase MltF [Agarilytica rhodophyticola]